MSTPEDSARSGASPIPKAVLKKYEVLVITLAALEITESCKMHSEEMFELMKQKTGLHAELVEYSDGVTAEHVKASLEDMSGSQLWEKFLRTKRNILNVLTPHFRKSLAADQIPSGKSLEEVLIECRRRVYAETHKIDFNTEHQKVPMVPPLIPQDWLVFVRFGMPALFDNKFEALPIFLPPASASVAYGGKDANLGRKRQRDLARSCSASEQAAESPNNGASGSNSTPYWRDDGFQKNSRGARYSNVVLDIPPAIANRMERKEDLKEREEKRKELESAFQMCRETGDNDGMMRIQRVMIAFALRDTERLLMPPPAPQRIPSTLETAPSLDPAGMSSHLLSPSVEQENVFEGADVGNAPVSAEAAAEAIVETEQRNIDSDL